MTRTYLMEVYAPGIQAGDVTAAATRARAEAHRVAAGGGRLEYLGATFVAEDDVVFHSFRADDRAVVEEAGRSAGLRFERVVESVEVDAGGHDAARPPFREA